MGFLGLIGFGGGATGLGLGSGAAPNDPNGHVASGGVISDYATPTAAYRAHIFNTPGSFVVTTLSAEFPAHVDYLVVGGGAGGGGGGGNSQAAGGGGGAGGYRTNMPEGPGGGGSTAYPSGYPVTAATFPVSVGEAGQRGMSSGSLSPAQPSYNSQGGDGYASYFGPPTARVQCEGGGRGGAGRGGSPGICPGGDGGSGGGAGYTGEPSWGGTENRDTSGNPAPGPAQGNGGPTAGVGGYPGPGSAGGGSGAGGDAGTTPNSSTGGPGGAGEASVIAYGPTVPLYYAGGGGGGCAPPTGSGSQSPGGSSVGGQGSASAFETLTTPNYVGFIYPSINADTAPSGRYNTGSGGGGGGISGPDDNGPGGHGSAGTVIIRYQIAQSDATASRKATGGAVSAYNDKIIHCFLHTQTFVTTSAISGAEVFVIGGGGGGGGGNGSCGGGGAGGYAAVTPVSFDSGCTYTATVGRGGQGGYRGDYRGENGADTTLAYTSGGPSPAFSGTITGRGGGYGGAYGNPVRAGATGGCGGGGAGGGNGGSSSQPTANPDYAAPSVTDSDTVGGNSHNPNHRGGGGGGIGGNGSDGDGSGPRNGGVGLQLPSTFRDPAAANALGVQGPDSSYYWVGGGGGGGCEAGSPNAEEPADHGKGGGGTGATGPWSGGGQAGTNTGPWISTPTAGYNGHQGTSNTGGGGGGGWWTDPTVGNAPWGFQGGDGGSGIILIAYPK